MCLEEENNLKKNCKIFSKGHKCLGFQSCQKYEVALKEKMLKKLDKNRLLEKVLNL